MQEEGTKNSNPRSGIRHAHIWSWEQGSVFWAGRPNASCFFFQLNPFEDSGRLGY